MAEEPNCLGLEFLESEIEEYNRIERVFAPLFEEGVHDGLRCSGQLFEEFHDLPDVARIEGAFPF